MEDTHIGVNFSTTLCPISRFDQSKQGLNENGGG